MKTTDTIRILTDLIALDTTSRNSNLVKMVEVMGADPAKKLEEIAGKGVVRFRERR